jgi:hypothetical protein
MKPTVTLLVKLLPCPKCEGMGKISRSKTDEGDFRLWFTCFVCGFVIPAKLLTKFYDDKKLAGSAG